MLDLPAISFEIKLTKCELPSKQQLSKIKEEKGESDDSEEEQEQEESKSTFVSAKINKAKEKPYVMRSDLFNLFKVKKSKCYFE